MSHCPFHIIIPARYQSSRLPGKPLLDIAGKPMIQHVVEQCHMSDAKSIVVATDDKRIEEVVNSFGGSVVMTSQNHLSGSDRIAEAVEKIGLVGDEIVVNVQGDEPDMPRVLINQVAQSLGDDSLAKMATASVPILSSKEWKNPSIVKVITGANGYAVCFSRAPIPHCREDDSDFSFSTLAQRHLGIYAYSAGYIREFADRPACPWELSEKLEQLRALWAGDRIRCVEAKEIPGPGIDTPEDLENFRATFIS